MSTDYPYSQQWRDRTWQRMAALDLGIGAMMDATGFTSRELIPALDKLGGALSLEVAGPIDELLDRLEEQREAKALRRGPGRLCRAMHVPGRGDLVPVPCDLDAPTKFDISPELRARLERER